jgi:hypothetical protein
MTDRNFVTLMRYNSPSEARFHQELLDNAGIQSVVTDASGEAPSEAEPLTLSEDAGPVSLMVPEEWAKRAGEVLEEGMDDNMGDNPAIE